MMKDIKQALPEKSLHYQRQKGEVEALLYKGDCLPMISNMPDKSIHLVITSPPYNVDKDYQDGDDKADDSMPYSAYLDWLNQVIEALADTLVDGGRVAININDQGRKPYRAQHAEVIQMLEGYPLDMLGCIVWDKMTPANNTAWGSWQSASSPSLRGTHEYILVAGKGYKRPDAKGKVSGKWEEKEFTTYTQETWHFKPETKRAHPAPFPYELPMRLIKLYSFEGDVVLDPFTGSGTTMKAALDLKRNALGFEMIGEYCAMASERLAQMELFDA